MFVVVRIDNCVLWRLQHATPDGASMLLLVLFYKHRTPKGVPEPMLVYVYKH
jgi:hypothetical protein